MRIFVGEILPVENEIVPKPQEVSDGLESSHQMDIGVNGPKMSFNETSVPRKVDTMDLSKAR
jgi:hypothetical protein